MTHKLLLDERPVVLQPSLVRQLGLLEAAIVQQLHYWTQHATRSHDDQMWVYKTYQEWAGEIGVSSKAIRGALDRLRKEAVVISISDPTNPTDRTLWWRIDYSRIPLETSSAPQGRSSAPAGRPYAPHGRPTAPAGSSTRASGCRSESTSDTSLSLEPLEEGSGNVPTPKSKPEQERVDQPERRATYSGKPVPSAVVEAAERALAAFNDAAGRRLGAWRANGQASEQLRQIFGQMLDRPDVDADEWERAVRCTVANPPGWVNGRPLELGDVFGPKAVEAALVNDGVPRPSAALSGTNGHASRNGVTASEIYAYAQTLKD